MLSVALASECTNQTNDRDLMTREESFAAGLTTHTYRGTATPSTTAPTASGG